ncbi:MAG: hypothetical protein PVF87_10310, partial [Acidimicrobiia bacterium]
MFNFFLVALDPLWLLLDDAQIEDIFLVAVMLPGGMKMKKETLDLLHGVVTRDRESNPGPAPGTTGCTAALMKKPSLR